MPEHYLAFGGPGLVVHVLLCRGSKEIPWHTKTHRRLCLGTYNTQAPSITWLCIHHTWSFSLPLLFALCEIVLVPNMTWLCIHHTQSFPLPLLFVLCEIVLVFLSWASGSWGVMWLGIWRLGMEQYLRRWHISCEWSGVLGKPRNRYTHTESL